MVLLRVYLAGEAGFCLGVKKTLGLAEKAVKNFGRVCSLGPLIHNPQEVARLAPNVLPVSRVEEAGELPLLIRSHGASPEVFAQAKTAGIRLIDATCPLVKRTQMLAKSLGEQGYRVVIVGDRNHPEVEAMLAWAGEGALSAETKEDALRMGPFDRLALISQTTQRQEVFDEITEILRGKTDE
ncbi:MAG: bifunctional 4-hydroxy-3-methylbut-2-enyl diphosphate reductase/30S ribosomal protein S1, partial [Clostridiales bacterium]|nr:bifunctional 4-hydroxy-3-methylbut-2-enyl diphosphate reductase/30S ribosomal protein S1 [Clostridiales bacterium]